MNKTRKLILGATLVLCNLLFFFSSSYIISSNDGSHFALVSSLVENRTVDIWEYLEYTRYIDYAKKDDKVYSDRVPGLAFFSIPFYMMGQSTEALGIAGYLTDHRNIKEIFVHFLPQIAGTLTVLLLFRLFLVSGASFPAALLAAFGFGVGSTIWMESSHFFSHSLSAALVLLGVNLLLELEFKAESAWKIYATAAAFGLASIVEIQNVLFLGPIGLYLLLTGKLRWSDFASAEFRGLFFRGLLVFGAIYLLLIYYNYRAFGEITIRSNTYNPNFPFEQSVFSSLSGNLLEGLQHVLFVIRTECLYDLEACKDNSMPGVLVTSPVFWLGVVYFPAFFMERRNEAILFVLLILVSMAIATLHQIAHPRTLTTILPYFYFPAIYFLRDAFQGEGLGRIWRPVVFLALVFVGSYRVYYGINLFFARSLDDPFPYLVEVPSLIYFYGCLGVIGLGSYLVWQALRRWRGGRAA